MPGHVPRVKARLALPSHRKVRGLLDGEYASVQTGRSMEFNDLREYVRGDDVKDLDWKASARSGQLLIRRYAAVRKHTVLLVVSTGRSMAAVNAVTGTVTTTKRELAVEVAGLLGWLATRQGDLVGVVHGDAGGQHGLPPRTGELHLERCLEKVHEAITPEAAPADLVGLLRFVARSERRRTIMLVVCDETDASPELTAALRRLAVQHELLVVTVGDVDPVGVPTEAGPLHDLDTASALPDWLRDDPRLREELRTTRDDAETRLHERLAALGIVHEHVGEAGVPLHAVRRLLTRSRHARR